MESYLPDGNRVDMRPFLYPSDMTKKDAEESGVARGMRVLGAMARLSRGIDLGELFDLN
jgi:hypothetical protein